MDASARARRIKLMAFDVDGVMTDGSLYFSDDGVEMKASTARTAPASRCSSTPALQ